MTKADLWVALYWHNRKKGELTRPVLNINESAFASLSTGLISINGLYDAVPYLEFNHTNIVLSVEHTKALRDFIDEYFIKEAE